MSQLDYMEIDDIEVFEILNNPLRIRVLRLLAEPRTVKEIADTLEVPPTRLYYHFNLLDGAGLIEVVETNKVGAMLQKVYQSKARGFRPSAELSKRGYEPHELAKIAAGVVLDGTRADAEQALTAHFHRVRDGEENTLDDGLFGRSVGFMTKTEAEAFVEKLTSFIEEEFDPHDSTDGAEYGLTFAFFPLAGIHSEVPR